MTPTRLILLIIYLLGLVGLAFVGGMFQLHGGTLKGNTPVVPVVLTTLFFSVVLLLVAGCRLLADLFPSGECLQEKGDRIWLGALSHFPLAVGMFSMLVEEHELAALEVPRAVLTGMGMTVLFWLLYYCARDLTARVPSLGMLFWVVVLLQCNIMAIPVYWWLHLRPRPIRQSMVGFLEPAVEVSHQE